MSKSSETHDLTAILRAEQRERWEAGTPVPAEDYLKRYPAIAADREAAIDLIHNEFLLAERFGPQPVAEEFLQRFPAYAETLRLQFDLHRAVAGSPTHSEAAAPSTQPLPHVPLANGEFPQHFTRYRLLGTLGQGGMGCVYLAHDEQLDRRVALKVPKFASGDREHADRFLREARIAAGFRHPHICPVYDVGSANGSYYLTMPVIEGHSLAERLKSDGPMSSRDAAHFVAKVARAVSVAHAAGVIHRDLKPGNIMLDSAGEPVVMDFGLARRGTVGENVLTSSGLFLGTPSYAAPEQIAGSAPTPGMDVYALGSILFECLTGRAPFVGRGDTVMRDKLAKDPEPPSRFTPTIDEGLSQVCLKAISRDPDHRFESTLELATALEAFPNAKATARHPHRRKLVYAAAVALIVIVVGVAAFWRPVRPTRSGPDLLPEGTIWVGESSFDPKDPARWDPALLWITKRQGDAFQGIAEVHNGDYAWSVEGTIDGKRVRWRYTKVIREATPTNSVAAGAGAEGEIDGTSIEAMYHDPGDASRATMKLRRVESDSRLSKAHSDKAWEFNDASKLDSAIEICDVALKLDDRTTTAYICRADAQIKKQAFVPAIADLDRAIAIDPNLHIAYVDRAWAESSLGQYDKAFADANQAVDLRPDAAEGYYQRGAAYAGQRKFFEALIEFSVAIDKRPDYAWAYFERGKAYRAVGYKEMADADFAKARKLDKTLPSPD